MASAALLAAIDSVWSSGDAESRVKRAAAQFLATRRLFTDSSVHVASNVSETVGSVSRLGLPKRFEQLLDEDPCFTVDKSLINARITLNVVQVFLARHKYGTDLADAAAQQSQGQCSDQEQGVFTASVPPGQRLSSVKATPKLLQGMHQVWPLTGPGATSATMVKHKVMYHLILTPDQSSGCAKLQAAVEDSLGWSFQAVGLQQTLLQLLQSEPNIFQIFRRPGNSEDAVVSLNVAGVVRAFVGVRGQPIAAASQQHPLTEQQPQQQHMRPSSVDFMAQQGLRLEQQQQQPAPGTEPVTGEVTSEQLLAFVRQRVWHTDPVLDAARLALAMKLVLKANPTVDQQAACTDAKRYSILGALAGHTVAQGLERAGFAGQGLCPSLEEVVDQDPYLTLSMAGSVPHVRLEVQQLLQDTAAAAAAASRKRQVEAAAATGSSAADTRRFTQDGAAASALGHSSHSCSNGGTARLPGVAADAGAAGGLVAAGDGLVTSQELQQHVATRVWHRSNSELDVIKRALAVQLVQQAHEFKSDSRPAKATGYSMSYAQAGIILGKARKAAFGPDSLPCYKKIGEVFEGDSCWISSPAGPTQFSVRLNVKKLFAEILSGRTSANGPNRAASATGSMQAGMAGAQQQQQLLLQQPAAAAAPAGSEAAQGAGSSMSSAAQSAASAAKAAAAGASSGAGAAEAAAAAVQAAAKSLMPPLTRSPAAPNTPAPSACTGSGQAAVEGSKAAAAGTAQPSASAAAVQQQQQQQQQQEAVRGVSNAPAAVAGQPRPFIPPWLLPSNASGILAGKVAAEQQQQQQSSQDEQQVPQLSVSANGVSPRHTGSLPAALSPGHELPAAAAATTTGAVASEPEPAVPLVYELQLTHAAPGWYTATYLPYEPQSGDAAAENSSSNRGSTATGSASSSAVADGLQQGSTGAGGAVQQEYDRAAAPAGRAADGASQVAAEKAAAAAAAAAEAPAGDLSDNVIAAATEGVTAADHPQQGAAAAAGTNSIAGGAGEAGAAVDRQEVSRGLTALLQALPSRLHQALLPYLSGSSPSQPALTHILIDRHHPVTLRFSDRSALYLPGCGVSLTDALQQLLEAQQQWAQQRQEPRGSSAGSQAADTLANGCSTTYAQEGVAQPSNSDQTPSDPGSPGKKQPAAKAAAAAVPDTCMDGAALQSAAQRLFQGASRGCLGVPFSCHSVSALSDARGDLCGLTYCICTHRPGAALALADVLTAMAARLTYEEVQDRPGSLLLLGRPGVGKTRLLRDVCRLMSLPPHQGGLGLHVLLLDTHGRVAGLSCQPSPDVGLTRCLTVHDSTQQAQLMSTAVLQHRPDVLVVHELSTPQDVEAAAHVSRRHNLLLVAGAAAHSLQQLLQDTTLCGLVGCERQAVSGTAGGTGNTTSQVQLRADRAPPFDTALELAGANRWCLHSVANKLADGAVRLGEQCSSVPTECRSLDAAGRLLVKFESASAAHRAQTCARVVSKLASAH